MSYRGLWGKIKATEEGLGEPLLTRNSCGAKGGGSSLTPLARKLIAEFKVMHAHINKEADDFFENAFATLVDD